MIKYSSLLTLVFTLFTTLAFVAPSIATTWHVQPLVRVDGTPITNLDVMARAELGKMAGLIRPTNSLDNPNLRQRLLRQLVEETVRLSYAKDRDITPTDAMINQAIAGLAEQNQISPEQFRQRMMSRQGAYQSLRQQLAAELSWGEIVNRDIRSIVTVTEGEIDQTLLDLVNYAGETEQFLTEIKLPKDSLPLARDLREQLDQGYVFGRLAQQHSQGIEAIHGGDMGWVRIATLPQTVQKVLTEAVEDAALENVSPENPLIVGPITTPSHVYLYQVLGQRQITMPNDLVTALERIKQQEADEIITFKQLVFTGDVMAQDENSPQRKALDTVLSRAENCDDMDDLLGVFGTHEQTGTYGPISANNLHPDAHQALANLPIGQASEPFLLMGQTIVMMPCRRDFQTADQNASSPDLATQIQAVPQNLRNQVAQRLTQSRMQQAQQRFFARLMNQALIEWPQADRSQDDHLSQR